MSKFDKGEKADDHLGKEEPNKPWTQESSHIGPRQAEANLNANPAWYEDLHFDAWCKEEETKVKPIATCQKSDQEVAGSEIEVGVIEM